MRLQKQVNQKTLDGDRIGTNLVVSRRLQPAQLQPVECRFAGHWRAIFAARFELARQNRHHRIMAQLVMIVEVLVAERNPKHALRNQRLYCMLNIFLPARVPETGGKSSHHANRTIRRTQQQRPRIRTDHPAIEGRYDFATFNSSKSKQICATLCRHRGAPRISRSRSRKTAFADRRSDAPIL